MTAPLFANNGCFRYKISAVDEGRNVASGCASQAQAKRNLVYMPRETDESTSTRIIHSWCTDMIAEARHPILHDVEDSHAFTLSFHITKADCRKVHLSFGTRR